MTISLRNVTKEYNLDAQTIITPVHNVSLDIVEGEFIIIIGRSGTGKTTFLNLVAGLIKPTSGQVLIGGTDICDMTDSELSSVRSQKLGVVFQFPSLMPSLTVLENVAIPSHFGSKSSPEWRSEALARAADLVKMMGLSERIDSYPRQLSAGEQKRVVIARSLLNQPKFLLADEPTSDLDELTEREIMTMLRDIHASGVTILMVTHSLELVPYATKAMKMENGTLVNVATAKTGKLKN